MNILMIGWEFPPFCSGGLGTHCYHLTRHMSKIGAKIIFLMPKTPNKIDCDYMKIVEVEPCTLGPYDPIVEEYGDFVDMVKKYNRSCAICAMKEEFDVIHCHDWMTTIAALEIKKKSGKPLVMTVHSTEYDRTGNLAPNEWILDLEKKAINGADWVIAVSEYMKKQLVERFGKDPEKIAVIYNAIDHEQWPKERLKNKIEDKIVLFIGRLTLQKGPDHFLNAAKRVLEKEENVKFIVGGKGDMFSRLIKQALDLGISDKVMFLGYVPDKQLPDLYGSSDVFVLSSVSEPFGITVLEAVASGTPTIISKQSGVREVVKNAFSVNFWDVDEMANKILSLLKYDELHETMRAEARGEIEKHGWDKIAKETVKTYSNT